MIERLKHKFAHDWSAWSDVRYEKMKFNGEIIILFVQYRECLYCNQIQRRELR